MSYSDFTLKKVTSDFQLTVVEDKGIFSKIEEVEISQHLATTLEENVPLAIAINTEKARSELIIANILIEIRKMFERKISFFSGIEFEVDKTRNLSGYCDFIVSLSPEQLFLSAPVIAIVEAKNENIMSGLGQCVAEMVAAKAYNEREGNNVPKVYGAVTSGNIWKFIKLENTTVHIDLQDYSIDNAGKILGIMSAMVKQAA
ncbi:MAG: hypothetical protein ACREEM_04355 [Blastocatellia bacterium]